MKLGKWVNQWQKTTDDSLLDWWWKHAPGFNLPVPDFKPKNPDWSDKISNEVWALMEEFRDDSMWEELTFHLSQYIYFQYYKNKKHNDETRMMILDYLESKIDQEFNKHGLIRILDLKKIINKLKIDVEKS